MEGEDTTTWCPVVPTSRSRVPTAGVATSSWGSPWGSEGALPPFPLTQRAFLLHPWGLSGHCPWPADCTPQASGSHVSMAVPASCFQPAPTSSNRPRVHHPPERDLPCPCWGCATGGEGGDGGNKRVYYFQGKDNINLKKPCKTEPFLICVPEKYLNAYYEIADVLL